MPEKLFLPIVQVERRPAGPVNHGNRTGSCSWQAPNMRLPTEHRGQAAEQSGSTCTGESNTVQEIGFLHFLCVITEEACF